MRPDPSTVRLDGPWVHRDVHANGIRLHVAEAGEGPLVLLLHGFAEFWWTWRHQLGALADAGYRTVAVDLRGYGDSDKPPRGYDAWTLAGDIGGLVKALGEPRAHLIGHAWGGTLAWTVAAMHPRLVRSVTAMAGAHPMALRREILRTALRRRANNQARALGHIFRAQVPIAPERWLTRDDAATVETYMRERSGPAWTETPDFANAVARHRNAMMVRGVAHSALEYYRWAARAQLRGEGRRFSEAMRRKITVPVLQIAGAVDPCVLPRTLTVSGKWATGTLRTRTLDGIGHFPQQEAPVATNRLLTEFLAG
ncbi:pimeloyl-ACP methyl ester carboxylesterase [Actinophytocola oryzae]|uniref:Pimeloyl-ACP methyl ester carboxylesterase n=1 Tax=Actinophytocola oryzae TaxID=502181 RepID=A0A4R7UV93_9PSEU|nr:pimeloyl-ACP methyl ester carboxylesterase [Actinophytocola oryzae]